MALVDVISALTLAGAARERLDRGGGAAAIGWAELAVAALLVLATVAMLRRRGALAGWTGGLAGGVLLLEGLSKIYGPKGHPSWALTLNGVVLVVASALGPRLAARRKARRALRLSDGGLAYRRSRMRRFTLSRAEVDSLTLDPTHAIVRTTAGDERRIDLADLHNRADVEAALRTWAAAQGVPVAAAGVDAG